MNPIHFAHALLLFAHNGIDHASSVEASAHQSYALLWVVVITVATIAFLYGVRRFLGRQPDEIEEEED